MQHARKLGVTRGAVSAASVLVVLALVGLVSVGCDALGRDEPAVAERPAARFVLQSDPTVVPPQVAPTRILPPAPTPTLIATDADAIEQLLVNLYRRVSPGVVHVEITDNDRRLLGGPQTGSGSGFVVDRDGHIVTNNHVVRDADRIRVIFADSQQFDAEVVGADAAIDLAIIRVDAPQDILHPVELGNSDVLEVGQRAIAIGNPFRFDQSMTVGIISALGRVVDPTESGDFVPDLIQTDAAINPGNSGGPLLDSRGRVIGINTLIFTETGTSVGVGFAVPVNTLRRSLPALLEGRRVGRPWLGIAGPPEITTELGQELGLSSQKGAYVNYVFPGGPGDEAGLIGANDNADGALRAGGDLITAVEGEPVNSLNDLLDYLNRETRVGQTVDLTVIRGGEVKKLSLTLGERPNGQ
jgi:S1-C subfamily serine protease